MGIFSIDPKRGNIPVLLDKFQESFLVPIGISVFAHFSRSYQFQEKQRAFTPGMLAPFANKVQPVFTEQAEGEDSYQIS